VLIPNVKNCIDCSRNALLFPSSIVDSRSSVIYEAYGRSLCGFIEKEMLFDVEIANPRSSPETASSKIKQSEAFTLVIPLPSESCIGSENCNVILEFVGTLAEPLVGHDETRVG
jgi:hypothetical protein